MSINSPEPEPKAKKTPVPVEESKEVKKPDPEEEKLSRANRSGGPIFSDMGPRTNAGG